LFIIERETTTMKRLFVILLCVLAIGCSQTKDQQVDQAIDRALSYLSDNRCDSAIGVLTDAGLQLQNGVYLQVLASAYGCKAGFDEVKYLSEDLATLNTNSNQIFGSLASRNYSLETAADSSKYTNVLTGINFLINSDGGTKPSQVNRDSVYGVRQSGDMAVQTLLLTIVNFGKFLHYYGNVNNAGVKGSGSGSNTCFLNYTDPRAQTAISLGNSGACTTNNSGHPDLSFAPANLSKAKRRVCEAVVYIANLFDILDHVDLSTSSTLSKLEDVSTSIDSYRTAANAAGLGAILDLTSQSDCETYLNTPANFNDMEYFFALVFESGLK